MMIGSSLRLVVLVTLLLGCGANFPNNNDKLQSVFEWKDLEYGFPTEADRQFALNNRLYIPRNGIPIDVDVYNKGKILFCLFHSLFNDRIIFCFQLVEMHVHSLLFHDSPLEFHTPWQLLAIEWGLMDLF